MRAVFFCSTKASTLTRSTSTLTTSSPDSGVGFGVGRWIAFRLGRAPFVLEFLLGVCELTELAKEKRRAAIMISGKAEKRNSRVGYRCFIWRLMWQYGCYQKDGLRV